MNRVKHNLAQLQHAYKQHKSQRTLSHLIFLELPQQAYEAEPQEINEHTDHNQIHRQDPEILLAQVLPPVIRLKLYIQRRHIRVDPMQLMLTVRNKEVPYLHSLFIAPLELIPGTPFPITLDLNLADLEPSIVFFTFAVGLTQVLFVPVAVVDHEEFEAFELLVVLIRVFESDSDFDQGGNVLAESELFYELDVVFAFELDSVLVYVHR